MVRANLARVQASADGRDIPDQVGFRDLTRFPQEVTELLRGSAEVQLATTRPWPKAHGQVRLMAIVDPVDEIAVRTAVAEFVDLVDDGLLGKDVVPGYRIGVRPPSWSYESPKRGHRRFRQRLHHLTDRGDVVAVIRTDVQRFYPSVDLATSQGLIEKLAGTSQAVSLSFRYMDRWRCHGVLGLPIGPEWSPTFAHAVLEPVDRALASAGYLHARWSDDIVIAVRRGQSSEDALDEVDRALAHVGLARSLQKTFIYDNLGEASLALADAVLSALQHSLKDSDPMAAHAVRTVFDEACLDPDGHLSRWRFAVRAMANRRDPYAADVFMSNPSMMEVDPRTVGDYLSALAGSHPDSVAALFGSLGAPTGERDWGVKLHIARAACTHNWGSAEATEFENLHEAARSDYLMRSWASEALAHTPGFNADLCVADAEQSSVRAEVRSAALPLRHCGDERRRRAATNHLTGRAGLLGPTAKFIDRFR